MDLNEKNAGNLLPETGSQGIPTMHSKASTGMQVVKKEEKEAKLKEFIATAVSPTSGTAEAAPAARTLTLLARSVDSPVALALSSLDSLLGSEGVTIRAIFASDAGVAALAMSYMLIRTISHVTNRRRD